MVKIIVGTMGRLPFAHVDGLSTKEDFSSFLETCQKHDIRELDTARVYGGGENERLLGSLDVSNRFTIGTKIMTGGPGKLSRENVLKSIDESLAALQTKCVEMMYIHRPDPSVPLQETLEAINERYVQGKFIQFGICHYTSDQVEEIMKICNQNGYVKPSIYQGAYNPVSRISEETLFPTLQKYGIHFYAFGPLASGLLAKSIEQLRGSQEGSRFGGLSIAKDAYLNDKMIDAVEKLHMTCQAEGVNVMNATMRWMQFHSALGEKDGFIIGASSVGQLEKSLENLVGGQLNEKLVAAFEELWTAVKPS